MIRPGNLIRYRRPKNPNTDLFYVALNISPIGIPKTAHDLENLWSDDIHPNYPSTPSVEGKIGVKLDTVLFYLGNVIFTVNENGQYIINPSVEDGTFDDGDLYHNLCFFLCEDKIVYNESLVKNPEQVQKNLAKVWEVIQ
jgi:hypothetical protein